MDPNIEIKKIEDVELDNPVILEGLPGIGFVGKVAADQIIEEFNATKFAEIESSYFPPQVIIKEDGLVDYMKNEFYYIRDFGEQKQDVVILTGNSQATEFQGQIALSRVLVEFFNELGASKIFTLGGLGTGEMLEKHRIFTASNNKQLLDEILAIDNTLIRKDEGGVIVGASGLILHYAENYGINAACLMGETPGFYIDPTAAKEVLLVLFELLDFNMSLDKINEKEETTRQKLALNPQFNQIEQQIDNTSNDDLRYIG